MSHGAQKQLLLAMGIYYSFNFLLLTPGLQVGFVRMTGSSSREKERGK